MPEGTMQLRAVLPMRESMIEPAHPYRRYLHSNHPSSAWPVPDHVYETGGCIKDIAAKSQSEYRKEMWREIENSINLRVLIDRYWRKSDLANKRKKENEWVCHWFQLLKF